jgi:hypothetical protein
MIHLLPLRRKTSPALETEPPGTTISTLQRLEQLLKTETGPAMADESREGEPRAGSQVDARRKTPDAAADQAFALEIAAVRAEALREGRNAATAEYERHAANERRRLLAAFEEQLADVRRCANESEAAAVRDARQAALAAAEQRLELERAAVREEAIHTGRAEAEAAAERRLAEHDKRLSDEFEARLAAVRTEAERTQAAALREMHDAVMAASQERLTAEVARVRDEVFMRLSAKAEQLIADHLRAAQTEDDWRLNRVAEVTRVLSALEADLTEIAAARRRDGDRVQIEVHQALRKTVEPEPAHVNRAPAATPGNAGFGSCSTESEDTRLATAS